MAEYSYFYASIVMFMLGAGLALFVLVKTDSNLYMPPRAYSTTSSMVHPHSGSSHTESSSSNGATTFSVDAAGSGAGSATSGRSFKGEKVRVLDPGMLHFTDDSPKNSLGASEDTHPLATGIDAHIGDLVCNRWSVVTTIFEPSDAVMRQASLENWCLCIVADKKGPTSYPIAATLTSHNTNHTNNVVYLTTEMQESLGHHIPLVSHLPWNHFGRKNVGYLYAILHGATEVWDFDDDNGLLKGNGHMQVAGFETTINSHSHRTVRHLSQYQLTNEESVAASTAVAKRLRNRRNLRPLGDADAEDDAALAVTFAAAEKKMYALASARRLTKQYITNSEVFPDACKALDIGDYGSGWDKEKLPVFNPYPIMGAPSFPSWPRGMPLAQIKTEDTEKLEVKEVSIPQSEIGVIQSLANGDPDVDAIYRLTQPLPFAFPTQYPKDSKKITPIKFDRSYDGTSEAGEMIPPIRTPKGTYAPYNAQATLHMYSTLWSLLLPVTVHGRVSDIWRGYFAQRLFEDIGVYLLFAPPLVAQDRNVHSYIADLDSEAPLYARAHILTDHLRNKLQFTASKENFEGRLEELWVWAYEHGYIELRDVQMMQGWIESLRVVGYKFPKFK